MDAIAAPLSPAGLAMETFSQATKKTSEGENGKGEGGESAGGGDAEGGKAKIEQKEFFWDQFLIYMATIIALLTVLDITLQLFRGGGLVCRLPARLPLHSDKNETVASDENETVAPSRDDVAYVNTFCQQSLSLAEYYPLFVLIQGLLLAAPQYLWASLFGGQFDFFFGLVRQLDRLRSSELGQYRPQNFEIVDKLEKHFVRKWSFLSIFPLYIIKLFIQLLVICVSFLFNGAVFRRYVFAFGFKCPRDFDPDSPPDGWWLPFQVACTFSSFRLYGKLQIVNYLLLSLAFCTVIYALIWCFKRHTNALGYKDIALFAFSSCLRPEEYVHSKFWKSPLEPRIHNDLDFLLLRLFRADSGYGNVFKDIQVRVAGNHRVLSYCICEISLMCVCPVSSMCVNMHTHTLPSPHN